MKKNLIATILGLSLLTVSCQKADTDDTDIVTEVPLPPSNLSANRISTTEINLSWTDNSTNEDGFKIERKTPTTNFSEIAVINKNLTTYNDKGLTKNTDYTYRVFAFNTLGNSLTYSSEVTTTTTDIPISASNLNATTLSHNLINLTWIDNATNEDNYKIERKVSGGSFSVIATLNANITSYNDSNLVSGTQYTYRVYPVNISGNGAFSNEATTTTLTIDISTDLVAFYPFTGNAGDSSGNNYHGIASGATLVADRFNNSNSAYDFSTTTSKINIPTLMPLSGVSKITYSFWKRYPTGLGFESTIFGFDFKYKISFGSIFGNPSKDSIYLWGSSVPYYASSILNQGFNWNHIAIVFDGTKPDTQKYSVYLNGKFETYLGGSGGPANFPNLTGTEKFFIQNTDNGSPAKTGQLDDFRIFKRALTVSEINYLATH